MRKILASFLAAAMVASVGATMSFAASTKATFDITIPTSMKVETITPGSASGSNPIDELVAAGTTIPAGALNLKVRTTTGDVFTFSNTGSLGSADNQDKIAAAFAGATAGQEIDGVNYTIKLTVNASAPAQLDAVVEPAGKVNFTIATGDAEMPQCVYTASTATANDDGKLNVIGITGTEPEIDNFVAGSGGVNNITDGDDMYYTQAIACDSNDQPIALVESTSDWNGVDGVRSGATVYFALNDPYSNPDLFKVKATKGKNAKNVKAISVVEKRFGDPLVKLSNGAPMPGTEDVRRSYVKVELSEIFTDDEYKITYDLKITTQDKGEKLYPDFADVTLNEDDIATVWLKNKVLKGDGDFKVGVEGAMIDPLANELNEITYYDEDSDVAFMKFKGDSDVSKFYAKLSTKWEHADYASYFNDQDAYIFDFTGSPKMSSTSRCDLQIYNPFLNEDGDETIDPETAVIYQVVDGDLFDVTDNFTYAEGENGDMAFVTRTRFLGTYIICEKAVEEAADATEEVPEIVPEEEAPVEVAPGGDNGGGKAPANTGKYL